MPRHRLFRSPTKESQPGPHQSLPANEVGRLALSSDTPLDEATADSPMAPEDFLSLTEVRDMVAWYESPTSEYDILDDYIEGRIEAAGLGREMKRRIMNSPVPEAQFTTVQALALALGRPGAYPKGNIPDRDALAKSLISSYAGQFPPAYAAKLSNEIFGMAVMLEPIYRPFLAASEMLVDKLQDGRLDDKTSRFNLALALAGSSGNEDDNSPERWLARLLHNPYSQGETIVKGIRDELLQGRFDQFLASRLVAEAELEPTKPAIRKMLDFAGLMRPEGLSADDHQQIIAAQELWPREAQEQLVLERTNLLNSLSAFSSLTKQELSDSFGMPAGSSSPETLLRDNMLRLAAAINASMAKRPVIHESRGNATVMRRRSSRAQRAATIQQSMPKSEIQPETRKEVRNALVVVDKDGGVHPEDSDKFRAISDDLLRDYRGTRDLEGDVASVISYLSSIDLRNLSPRSGLVKLSEGSWRVKAGNEIQQVSLFRFKPTEAPGLPLKTQVIKRHRVLLTLLDNDTVGLISFVHRDKLNLRLKNLGIGSSVSR